MAFFHRRDRNPKRSLSEMLAGTHEIPASMRVIEGDYKHVSQPANGTVHSERPRLLRADVIPTNSRAPESEVIEGKYALIHETPIEKNNKSKSTWTRDVFEARRRAAKNINRANLEI